MVSDWPETDFWFRDTRGKWSGESFHVLFQVFIYLKMVTYLKKYSCEHLTRKVNITLNSMPHVDVLNTLTALFLFLFIQCICQAVFEHLLYFRFHARHWGPCLFSLLPLSLEMMSPKIGSPYQCPACREYNDSTPHTLSPPKHSLISKYNGK